MIPMQWNGSAFVPHGSYWQRIAAGQYEAGKVYQVEHVEDRSAASHRQYFAAVNDYWSNLPEGMAEDFPTPEHLRKYALIKCGYADRASLPCSSAAEARRIAAFVRPRDEFALVLVEGSVITAWTAQSQKQKAMGKEEFQASKTAVLEFLAALIGAKSEAHRQMEAA